MSLLSLLSLLGQDGLGFYGVKQLADVFKTVHGVGGDDDGKSSRF